MKYSNLLLYMDYNAKTIEVSKSGQFSNKKKACAIPDSQYYNGMGAETLKIPTFYFGLSKMHKNQQTILGCINYPEVSRHFTGCPSSDQALKK